MTETINLTSNNWWYCTMCGKREYIHPVSPMNFPHCSFCGSSAWMFGEPHEILPRERERAQVIEAERDALQSACKQAEKALRDLLNHGVVFNGQRYEAHPEWAADALRTLSERRTK